VEHRGLNPFCMIPYWWVQDFRLWAKSIVKCVNNDVSISFSNYDKHTTLIQDVHIGKLRGEVCGNFVYYLQNHL
jgi:hypothetical protein